MKFKTLSRVIAIILAVISILTSVVPAFAAENSKGSKGTDIAVLDDSNYSVAGQDTKQNKKSEYELFTYDGNDIISSVNVYGTIADGSDVYDPENPDADENGFVNGKIQVGVPTTIIIDGKPDSHGYYIGEASGKVKGNISGSTIINVVPDAEVTLQSQGKADVTAPIEQDYTQFVVSTSEYSGEKVNKHVTPSFNDKAVFDVSVKTKDLSAGSWSGSFNYNISVTDTSKAALGRRITSWNISATQADDVWMTYYQPTRAAATRGSTQVATYEDGTVVISGTGNMEEDVNRLFYDLEAMSVEGNRIVWEEYPEVLTEEEYATLLEYIEEGTAVFKFVGAANSQRTETIMRLPAEIREIANKGVDSFFKVKREDYKIFAPKSVIIENGVTNISNRAFSTCNEIETLTIGESVTTIGTCAFQNCMSIKSIDLPESVTTIGSLAFVACNKATDIYLKGNITAIGARAFDAFRGTIHCPTQAIADLATAAVVNGNPTIVVD